MTKILVIDDDELTRSMICHALKKAGFEVLEAANGNDGVQKAKDDKPDLVVTDILMPDKEGIETILEIQALDRNIKIVAMSGGGATKNMTFLEMAKKAGAKYTLSKPFKPSVLLEIIDRALTD